MNILKDLEVLARQLPERAAPWPFALPGLGQVGHLTRRRGLYINSAVRRQVVALQEADLELERVSREISRGRLGSSDLYPVLKRGTDCVDAIRVIKSAEAFIDSWADILQKTHSGKFGWAVYARTPSRLTTNRWCNTDSFSGGTPPPFPAPSVSYPAIPSQPALDVDSFSGTGSARFFPRRDSTVGTPYLAGLSSVSNVVTSDNPCVCLVVDQLQGMSGVVPTVTTTQDVNTTQNLRWQDGEGVYMALAVTANAASGGGALTGAISYTDQDGNPAVSQNVDGVIWTLAGQVIGSTAGSSPPFVGWADGGYGARSIQSILFTGTPAASGQFDILMYKPIILYGFYTSQGIFTAQQLEKELPLQTLVRPLTDTASLPYLTYFYKDGSGAATPQSLLMDILWS
jgi:hypothetical protein